MAAGMRQSTSAGVAYPSDSTSSVTAVSSSTQAPPQLAGPSAHVTLADGIAGSESNMDASRESMRGRGVPRRPKGYLRDPGPATRGAAGSFRERLLEQRAVLVCELGEAVFGPGLAVEGRQRAPRARIARVEQDRAAKMLLGDGVLAGDAGQLAEQEVGASRTFEFFQRRLALFRGLCDVTKPRLELAAQDVNAGRAGEAGGNLVDAGSGDARVRLPERVGRLPVRGDVGGLLVGRDAELGGVEWQREPMPIGLDRLDDGAGGGIRSGATGGILRRRQRPDRRRELGDSRPRGGRRLARAGAFENRREVAPRLLALAGVEGVDR